MVNLKKIEAPEATDKRGNPIYPWKQLRPGYAFFVTRRPNETQEDANQRVRSAAGQWGRRHGASFLVAQAKDGNWYCWRIDR